MQPTSLPQNNQSAAPTVSSGNGLDPHIIALAKAIRDNEAGTNYTAAGQSGEFGAYQITHGLYDGLAPKYGINTPLEQTTPEEQNKFVYDRINELQGQGYNPGQIASIWNSGGANPSGKIGTNKFGASYNTPQYVDNVYNAYVRYKGEANTQTQNSAMQPAGNGMPTYGATFPYQQGDNPLVAGAKAVGNLPSSIYGFGAGIAGMVFHPLQTIENLGGAAIGGLEELTGNQGTQRQTFDNLVGALKQRYGGLDQLTNTAVNDPFGLGSDIAGLLAGGAGLVGKGAELGELGSRAAQIATSPATRTLEKITAPFGTAVDAGAEEAATRLGMEASELPASARSTSPVVAGVESLAGNAIGGGGVFERATTAADRLSAVADSMVAKAGGAPDLEAAGEALGTGLNKFISDFKSSIGDLYDAFQSKVGDKLARTNNAVDTLNTILDRKAAIGDTQDAGFFQSKLKALENAKKPPTFSTLKEMRTDVGNRGGARKVFGDPFATANGAQLKQLYGAITDDMYATMKATRGKKAQQLVQEYDRINAVAKEGYQKAGSALVEKITRMSHDQQFDKIMPALLKPSVSLHDIRNIMEMTGEAGKAQIRSSLMRQIFDKGLNADGHFTPAMIGKDLEKNGARYSQILTPEQFQGLQDVATIAKSLGRLTRRAGGSQTAFLLDHLAQGGLIWWGATDLLSGNLVGAAQKIGAVIGTYGASRFIASDAGQRLLTEGLLRPTIGKDVLAEADRNGLTPPSASGNNPGNGGTPAGGPVHPNASGAPIHNSGTGGEQAPAAGAGGASGETQALSQANGGGRTAELSAPFQGPQTVGGKIKEALKNYFDNTQPGLSTKDVTEGGQKFNVGITSVKGAVETPMDEKVAEADSLFKAGKFDEAQAAYKNALQEGANTLANAFNGTGINIKPKGTGFGIYGGLEPNFDLTATVPKAKEDLFHYILADVADKNFHQYSVLTYRQTANDAALGVVDQSRGISNEPFFRMNLNQAVTAADVQKIQKAAEEAGLAGASVREGGKAIDVINLTAYNKEYEKFIEQADTFFKNLDGQGFSGSLQQAQAETRFIGSNPDEGHGAISYDEFRSNFRTQNKDFFNSDSGATSRVLERLKNRQTVSAQEVEQLTKSQDISPIERSTVLDALDSFKELTQAKRIPMKNLAAEIEGRSLPVKLTETNTYANYGIDNVGIDYSPSKGEGAKTLVFETPIKHGDMGHFDNPNHIGHTRIVITEDGGKKIGYITEVQSDVAQKADIQDQLIGYDKIAQARKDAAAPFRKEFDDMISQRGELLSQRTAAVGEAEQAAITKKIEALEPQMDAVQAKMDEATRNATDELRKQGLQPQQQQLISMLKDRTKYQDVLMRGTLQYLKEKGVQEVRVATPSSAAKIEGFYNEEDQIPYEHPMGDPYRPQDGDLEHGDNIGYLGDEYTVVDARGENIEVAPADKVRTFRFSEYADEEAQSAWDDQAKSDFEPLATKGGDITPAAAEKALASLEKGKTGDGKPGDIAYFEYHGTPDILEKIAEGDKRWSMSDVEEAVKEKALEHTDFSNLQDIYGKNNVFSHEIGKGYDSQIYVVEDGTHTETLGQPSTYNSSRLDDFAEIDNNPKLIDEQFDNTQATVLKNYLALHDKVLKKLAREENIKLETTEDTHGGNTWYSFPLTNVKRYLFGGGGSEQKAAKELAAPQAAAPQAPNATIEDLAKAHNYDLKGARAQGYSDNEILSHLKSL